MDEICLNKDYLFVLISFISALVWFYAGYHVGKRKNKNSEDSCENPNILVSKKYNTCKPSDHWKQKAVAVGQLINAFSQEDMEIYDDLMHLRKYHNIHMEVITKAGAWICVPVEVGSGLKVAIPKYYSEINSDYNKCLRSAIDKTLNYLKNKKEKN